jgi:hypothetical protein
VGIALFDTGRDRPRVLFDLVRPHRCGFVKKSQKTPDNELDTANRRLAKFKMNRT